MVAKNKHHVWKERGPKPWGMSFPSVSLISSRKIITIKVQQNLGHFGIKQVDNSLNEFIIYFICSNREIPFQKFNKLKILPYPSITEILTVITLLIDYNGLGIISS